MKILVANLGSTSFKYRLFNMADESLLARGGFERIGTDSTPWFVEVNGKREEGSLTAPDHAAAVGACLEQLAKHGCLKQAADLGAIGFKSVHAKGVTGAQLVTPRVLEAMEAYNEVAPAHNPPYVAAMRLLAKEFPSIPLVAAFETGFHQTIPPGNSLYAVPLEWAENHGVRKWGFHGASHRFIAGRAAQLLNKTNAKIISCHLGGSNSLCAIDSGKSIACTLGMSPQSGLPHNNRVGDFDVFALPVLLRETGKNLEQLLDQLANHSGLEGLCGLRDMRDIEKAAKDGDHRAQTALDVFFNSIQMYIGGYIALLGGVDGIFFTGGIGENSSLLREKVISGLGWMGIDLDPAANATAKGEQTLHKVGSRAQVWILPTNEEIVVARQSRDLLAG